MRYSLILFPVLLLTVCATAIEATTLHVPSFAYPTIQSGIDASFDGDSVLVAPGTYYENIDFLGRAIWLLSQDGPNTTIIHGTSLPYPVVQCVSNEISTTILQGFTITGGAYGGMLNSYSSPTVTLCIFRQNTSDIGGGMYNDHSNPIVEYCTFRGNSADYGGGMSFGIGTSPYVKDCMFSGNTAAEEGGGIYDEASSPTITKCTFSGNSADYGGGVSFGIGTSPFVNDCTFSGNTAAEEGGGIYDEGSSSTVTICSFSGNSAAKGGGVSFGIGTSPFINNCTFTGNKATLMGGGMFSDVSNPAISNCTFTENSALSAGGMWNNFSNPILTNCIFWGNFPDEIRNWNSAPTVTYSNVHGGYPGVGNIDADPLFVTFHGLNNLLMRGSSSIDAGDPAIVDGFIWPSGYNNGPRSDMGAYGGPENSGWFH